MEGSIEFGNNEVLENISPFKVEKIIEELPDSAAEDLGDENDLLAAK